MSLQRLQLNKLALPNRKEENECKKKKKKKCYKHKLIFRNNGKKMCK